MLSHKMTYDAIERAIELHRTVFFTDDLRPVVPQPSQWFRETQVDTCFGGLDVMQDGALVQYVGEAEAIMLAPAADGGLQRRMVHHVIEAGTREPREPHDGILILQQT